MMWFLNRARGGGIKGSAPFIGMAQGWLVAMVFNNPYVGFAVATGYIFGESFGWGEWVGTLSTNPHQVVPPELSEEGKNNGIQWIASKIVPMTNWIWYCRVAMVLRGFYWFFPLLTPLYFVGFSPVVLGIAIAFLSFTFPLAYDMAYRLQDRIYARWNDKKKKYEVKFFGFEREYEKNIPFCVSGGWDLGEVISGVIMDIAFIGLTISYFIK